MKKDNEECHFNAKHEKACVTYSMFSRLHISLYFSPRLLVRVPLPFPAAAQEQGCTSTSSAHRRGGVHLHGRLCQNERVPQQRSNRTDSTTTAQRRTLDARHADSAARGRPRRSRPRPSACPVGQNLTIAKHRPTRNDHLADTGN